MQAQWLRLSSQPPPPRGDRVRGARTTARVGAGWLTLVLACAPATGLALDLNYEAALVTDDNVNKAEADEDVREDFRKTLVSFRNLYAFMAQVIPFQDTDLERLYSYIRFLLTKVPRDDRGPIYDFNEDVALKYYRLQKISEGSIQLGATVGDIPLPQQDRGQLPVRIGASRLDLHRTTEVSEALCRPPTSRQDEASIHQRGRRHRCELEGAIEGGERAHGVSLA